MNADVLVDRKRQYYWCKVVLDDSVKASLYFQVPKAASTSWISLILSDREFSEVNHKIGQQHLYLRLGQIYMAF